MARTKQQPRSEVWKYIQKTPAFSFQRRSEPMIRKYYPKNPKFFLKGFLRNYQGDQIANPNSRILMRYKRDIFKSFSTNLGVQGLQSVKLPHHVEYLTIHNGCPRKLKKLIKQNKRLKHIESAVRCEEMCLELLKLLKYCRNLCSINLDNPFFSISEKTLKSMRRSFGKTLQKVTIEEKLGNYENTEAFTKEMEMMFEFPKLKEIKFNTNYFPAKILQQLQDKNVACDLKLDLPIETSEAFLETLPGVKPNDYVRITMRNPWETSGFFWDKSTFEKKRIQSLCQQVRDLDISALEEFHLSALLERFSETSNLELVLSIDRTDEADYSKIEQFSNLKHLNIDIEDYNEHSFLSDFFSSLSKSAKNLEELIMRMACCDDTIRNGDLSVIQFFQHCAETLKKACFEFRFAGRNFKELEPLYEGMRKLNNLQSFSILLAFGNFKSVEKIEELSDVMSKMKSLEEVDVRIEKQGFEEKPINPSSAKKKFLIKRFLKNFLFAFHWLLLDQIYS